MKIFTKRKWFMPILGIIIGAFIVMGIRFATYEPEEEVHYHANFAMYLNGQREQFKEDFYYTESAESCGVETAVTPRERGHLHDSVNDVVHVEDEAVTWGNFFQNLGWAITPEAIVTPSKVLLSDDSNKVSFTLNGESVDGVMNTVIKDLDRLLIDYGNSSPAVLKTEFDSIASTALRYDTTKDPATCSGHSEATMGERFRHMF